MHNKVTVLIAIYKAGRYLASKIKNIQAQTIFSDCSFILLNCQNLEEEDKIYENFLNRHSNVHELRFNKYQTLYSTWNKGITTTTGDYICNANVDDMWAPSYLAKCVALLEQGRFSVASSFIATCDVPNQWDHGQWVDTGGLPEYTYPLSTAGPCPVWKRDLHAKYGLFGDYSVIGDARMWEKWHANNEEFGLVKEHLTLYYNSPDSLERRIDPKTNKLLRKIDLEK